MLTHVVDSSWNDDIYVLLRLGEGGEKKKSLEKKFSDQTPTTCQGGFYTYRQAKLLKSRFDKRRVLCENLLQVSASAHVSQNCRDR